MIDRHALLSDLRRILRQLEADLRQRCDELPEVGAALRAEYDAAKEAERTAENFEDWKAGYITQVAAAWVLSCVFVRFLEDNQLVDPPRISGPGERLRRARDEYDLYVRQYPAHTYREYLLSVFDRISELPGGREVLGKHNPIHQQRGWLSGDAARELLDFFQKIEPTTGTLVHDFGDPNWDTRFLGDLYQDLSEEARDKYALLQTPEFVEEFILDRTLDPAVEEFGLDGFRMIDPACGSGHFLLGSFHRLFQNWSKKEPATNPRVLAQRALDSIHGVDVNPYAAAIARFRLLLVALRTCRISRLADAPAFEINVACGDSLLHGTSNEQLVLAFDPLAHAYRSEDLADLRRILKPGRYNAVVANPPYITPKDRALNQAYRERYPACHRQYSLSVPFMQRIIGLAVEGGYTGQITSNSFMKREFGKKLIEEFLPGVDLTHVIDASGAYIPGHGTPTVILFSRNRPPVSSAVRAVLGINAEPSTPSDPARGCVWSAILQQVDQPGSQSSYISVSDTIREKFHHHPWSIGGGGAADLKAQIDQCGAKTLADVAEEMGFGVVTREDDLYQLGRLTALRHRIPHGQVRPLVAGEEVRDWQIIEPCEAIWPYEPETLETVSPPSLLRLFWPWRTRLAIRVAYGLTQLGRGLKWHEYSMFFRHRFRTPLTIIYGEVATHNHFVLDRGGRVFKQTAPVIKLPQEATEDDHLGLLGLLNSSTACFWMKQMCHQKQMMGGDGVRIESKAKVPYAFNATAIGKFPIPESFMAGELRKRLIESARQIERLSQELNGLSPQGAINIEPLTAQMIRGRWNKNLERRGQVRSQQVQLQEEMDFTVYQMFGLVGEDGLCSESPLVEAVVTEGDRPFCIIQGKNEDGFTVPDGIPERWPCTLKLRWEKRMAAIHASRDLSLIESSMYKRRWIGRQGVFNHQRSNDELSDAAKRWLFDRLESYFDFDGRLNAEGKPTARLDMALISAARLADLAARDVGFMQVGELYRGRPDFDVARLVAELVEDASVPLLSTLRYKPVAMEKRRAWERAWELQRQEDEIDARTMLPADNPDCISEAAAAQEKRRLVGEILVPPEYKSTDFLKGTYWRLRGKLDVPKERWVSFPHCEGEDQSAVVAWAGYDHLQLAQAIGTYYADTKERGGTKDPRLVPLLASILELVPWLRQWHNDLDPAYNLRMGDYYAGFAEGEAKELEMTVQQIRDWQPPRQTGRRRRS
jgi:hypothetical protein